MHNYGLAKECMSEESTEMLICHHHWGNTIGPTCAVDQINHTLYMQILLSTKSICSGRIVS